MERHPYFDLWLHSDRELTAHLNQAIVERVTVHEWPLSCVQLLHLADGSQRIYKSQLAASSVEPEFYLAVNHSQAETAQICASRLVNAECLGKLESSTAMLVEYIQAPRLDELHLTEAEIVEHGSHLLSDLRQFPQDLPVYIDISSSAKWSVFVKHTLRMLNSLIKSEQFQLTTPDTVAKLQKWSESGAILKVLEAPAVINHGDLCGDNVFVTPDGYKIIDWQRPVRGPAELDLATFYFTMGVEPIKYLCREIVDINIFLHLRWFVEAKLRWFPAGDSYDRQVAELADLILHETS
jgi:hypothetical protein